MADEKFRTVLFFGAPGVGKGTQGRILGQQPGYFHLSCGDVFRSLDPNSPLGREVHSFTDRGELVPDELTVRLWRETMGAYIASGRYSPGRHLLVLDGIPRNVPQAELLSDSINVVCIVHLVCANEDQMIERLKRRALAENRADDADEAVIRHRFEVYHRQSRPVLDYYPHKLVLTVEALATPEEVAKNIQGGLAPLRRPNVAQ